MRNFVGLLTSAAVATGLLVAPFMHVHDAGHADDHMADEHAGALAFHMHVGEETGGAFFGSLAESARQLDWFVLKKADPPTLPAVAEARSQAPTDSSAARPLPPDSSVRPTESPHLRRLAPRAPPA